MANDSNKPRKELIKCDVTGYTLHSCEMRVCPHPTVRRQYADGEPANVSVWACKKCRYFEAVPMVGMRCKYEEIVGRGSD